MQIAKINHYNGVKFGLQIINNGKVLHFSWMDNETKDAIDNMISYYRAHSPEAMITSGDQRLQYFVIEDFSKLLALLEMELENA